MNDIAFTVFGHPATAGSKRAFPFKRKDGGLGVRVAPDHPGTASYRGMVVNAARAAGADGELWRGPLGLRLIYFRPRPKSHLRSNGEVKDSAPEAPTMTPDLLKIARQIEDSLKGVCYKDDSQFVAHALTKLWGEPERVEVTIEPL